MLVLGPGQLDALERHMLNALQARLQQVIAATFPELNDEAPGERLRSIIHRGVESATRYGIEEAPDLAAFIALGLASRTLPPGTSIDWIRDWLERPDTAGATKLAIIEQLASGNGNPAFSALTARVKQARRGAQGL